MSRKAPQTKKPVSSPAKGTKRTKPPVKVKAAATARKPAKSAIQKESAPAALKSRASSKQACLIKLLSGESGATLAQMIKLTGWQPHTVRGVISGVLRKKLRFNVTSDKPAEGERIYRITPAKGAAAPAASGA